MTEARRVSVGVGVIVFNDGGEFLLMKRLSKHANGTYALPGGWLEFGEDIEECAAREVMEELGVDIMEPKVLGITNNKFPSEDMHTVSVLVAAKIKNGMPKIMEPHKCESFAWYKDWENFPKPMMTDYSQYVRKEDLERYLQSN